MTMSRYINRRVPIVRGRNIRLSLPRRFVVDLLHFAKKVPSVPMQRHMQLSDVMDARAAWQRHVIWCAIFLKAYAIISAERPGLRRAFIPFPWGHLYEHPVNVASSSLERTYRGENSVFFARIPRPELISLEVLDRIVRSHKAADVEAVDSYRHALQLSRLPRPIRRFIWWLGLETDGRYKARFFGTFGISVVASFGPAGSHIVSPLTTTLNYGTFAPDGGIDVRMTYDHRVIDGATAARALVAVEDVLHNQIRDELLAGPRRHFAGRAPADGVILTSDVSAGQTTMEFSASA